MYFFSMFCENKDMIYDIGLQSMCIVGYEQMVYQQIPVILYSHIRRTVSFLAES